MGLLNKIPEWKIIFPLLVTTVSIMGTMLIPMMFNVYTMHSIPMMDYNRIPLFDNLIPMMDLKLIPIWISIVVLSPISQFPF